MVKKVKPYIRTLKGRIWKKNHNKRLALLKESNINSNVSIISCNCIGGVMSHELGLQFLSPTVNLFLDAKDYLLFCENLEFYINSELKEYCGSLTPNYPLADLNGLTLHLVHYHSFEEAKEKWEKRSKRVNYDDIFIIATDRDGMNNELMERFDKLPYSKVMFVSGTPKYSWQFKIQGCVDGNCVGDIIEQDLSLKGITKGIRYFDQYDWVNNIFNKC